MSTRGEGETHESRQSLWLITIAPIIWTAHFLASYLTAAIWCARVAAAGQPIPGVRLAILGYTAAALAGIAWAGWMGYRRHALGTATLPHDFDSPEDRHRFLGFATLLLAGLSAIATVFVGMVIIFVKAC